MSRTRKETFRPGFTHELFVLVLPIVIQNLIVSSVSMADVVMLGRVSQTALSASSLAGQVQFLLNIIYFGLNSAITIMAAQYWGKNRSCHLHGLLDICNRSGLRMSGQRHAYLDKCP